VDEFRRKPVNRAKGALQPQSTQLEPAVKPVAPQPIETPPVASAPKKKSYKKRILWSIVGLVTALLFAAGGLFAWYSIQLSPVDSSATDRKLVKIEPGSTPNEIATLLEEEGLVRSSTVFLLHTRLEGVQNSLQAGTYRLSPSESTQQITEHLSSGKIDSFKITFLPGATLADNRKAFLAAGYEETEIDAAFSKTYDSPLFEGKPASADLEGYIYGETYVFGTETTVEAILEHVFDEFYGVVKENNLIALYKAQGLSLYQGITLASIVQREASPAGDEMAQIAQVFYHRIAEGMPLGSDVTYQYIADKTGVARDPNLDSPYNTRRYIGLPPGPISVPGKKALIAVGTPAGGDYLYFLSGDDDVTYFSRDLNGHEANIKNHCQKKCQIL
jgi:UPF0755 protein